MELVITSLPMFVFSASASRGLDQLMQNPIARTLKYLRAEHGAEKARMQRRLVCCIFRQFCRLKLPFDFSYKNAVQIMICFPSIMAQQDIFVLWQSQRKI